MHVMHAKCMYYAIMLVNLITYFIFQIHDLRSIYKNTEFAIICTKPTLNILNIQQTLV